jgi:hypothetical protein
MKEFEEGGQIPTNKLYRRNMHSAGILSGLIKTRY